METIDKDIVIFKDSLDNWREIEEQYDKLISSRNDIEKHDYKNRIIYSKIKK